MIKGSSAQQTELHKRKAPSAQESNALAILFNQGRYAEAMNLAGTMTEKFPMHEFGWKILGLALQNMGRNVDAIIPMQKLIQLSPDDAEAHNNLGITLQQTGRLGDAEYSFRRAIKSNPQFFQAYNNLANTLCDLHRLAEAEVNYRQALQIKPDYAEAQSNLGATLHEMGRLGEAEASYRRVLEIGADFAEAHYNLANTLRDMDRFGEAEASYRRALQIRPDYAQAYSNIGVLLQDLGRLDEAEASFRQALQIEPNYVQALSNLGRTLNDLGRLDEAEASYRRALRIKPDYAEVLSNLGNTLRDLGRLAEAETCYRQAVLLKPDYAEAYSNLGSALHDLGRMAEAEANWRQALRVKPDYAMAHSNLLFCLAQNATVDAKALYLEHRRFGEQFETAFRSNPSAHRNDRDATRSLKIGFVSGDLRNHAVSNFIEPLLAHLSGYPQLTLHAYANNSMEDSTTQRLRGNFASWNMVAGMKDAALAEKIRADRIDILIDLSGHTAKNRLPVFARKPAPVQVSWMGYPGTTGLSAMDYYFADRFFLPPGKFEDQFTEKIVRLPANAPFLPSKDAPPVNSLPALANGHLTFGSFNRIGKLSREVIALWSQLLRALPASRMVLGGIPEQGTHDFLAESFAREGIARNRLDFHARSDMHSYLKLHQQIDICLDTFPYNGGTTTLHAMWMGVPSITLAGNTAVGRPGASILEHLGLEQFVAHDAEEFVRKGLYWAGDLAALSVIRADLRGRFAKSAIGQPQCVAAGLERALRIMWQRWCADLPAESFEVTGQEEIQAIQEAGK